MGNYPSIGMVWGTVLWFQSRYHSPGNMMPSVSFIDLSDDDPTVAVLLSLSWAVYTDEPPCSDEPLLDHVDHSFNNSYLECCVYTRFVHDPWHCCRPVSPDLFHVQHPWQDVVHSHSLSVMLYTSPHQSLIIIYRHTWFANCRYYWQYDNTADLWRTLPNLMDTDVRDLSGIIYGVQLYDALNLEFLWVSIRHDICQVAFSLARKPLLEALTVSPVCLYHEITFCQRRPTVYPFVSVGHSVASTTSIRGRFPTVQSSNRDLPPTMR